MNKTALELYIYMCSHEPIIKWLESEGVTTKDEALEKLSPLVENLVRDVATSIKSGNGGTLAGANNCINKVIKHFESKK
jgi:hypothetical protein